VGGLLAVVGVAAIGFAALKEATETWALVVWALALAMLIGATVRAWLRQGRERASWAVEAVAGWAYASACLFVSATRGEDPSPITSGLDWLHQQICGPEYASKLFPRANFDESFSAWSAAHPEVAAWIRLDQMVFDTEGSIMLTWQVPTLVPFEQIGHGLLTVIFAVAGGMLTRLFFLRPGHRGPKEPCS
jgi:hypothetical protein